MGGNLKWQIIAAKAQGTSHTLNGENCEDYFAKGCVVDDNGDEVLFCFVSDGAGSAQRGESGSQIACTAAERFLAKNRGNDISEVLVYELIEHIIAEIKIAASEEQLAPREFACTFLGVLISTTQAHYFQIGDGGIVVKDDLEIAQYQVIFWPKAGEYVNMTTFITDEDAIANLMVKSSDSIPIEVCLFTDGLQRLCLQFETMSVHEPFFQPIFSLLTESKDQESIERLNVRLASFLNSSRVNERTDDDKTLVLAARVLHDE